MPSPEAISSEVRRPSFGSALASLLPTILFLLADRWFGLVPAMLTASLSTIGVILVRRRNGRIVGVLLPITLAFVVVKAIAGVWTESQFVYFGSGLALSAAIGLGVGATAFTKRPVGIYAIPLVTPYRHLTNDHPVYRRVAAHVTAVWALAELAITAWEAWHLTAASASEFVVTRSIVAWPIMGVVIFFLVFYVRFRLDRYELHLASKHTISRSVDAHA